MTELFFYILLMSLGGSVCAAVLFALKPVASKLFPAGVQYGIWITATLLMVIPFWKLLPDIKNTDKAEPSPEVHFTVLEHNPWEEKGHSEDKAVLYGGALSDAAAYVWAAGALIFLVFAETSYAAFLVRKKKLSRPSDNAEILERVKSELGIKRRIKLRIVDDNKSPMLVGVFFPTVYIPADGLEEEKALLLVLHHELTHFRHKDLLFKQFSLVVNALHWFNPFAYALSRQLGKSCELFCDMSVTSKLDETDKRLYMNTILNLTENRKED